MHILTFRLSIFGNYQEFTPTTANTILWTQALQKAGHELLPSIIEQPAQQVMSIPFVPVQIGKNEKRMQFVSQAGDCIIRILSDRVDVELTQGLSEDINQYFVEKLDVIAGMMDVILNALGKVRGNRLAYYIDALIPEVNSMTFNQFYQKNNLGISVSNLPDECVEWNHRFNRRVSVEINGNSELCNIILGMETGLLQTVNTVTGEAQTLKGLHILSDINTLAENTKERFQPNDCSRFAVQAQNIFLDLLRQIRERLFS